MYLGSTLLWTKFFVVEDQSILLKLKHEVAPANFAVEILEHMGIGNSIRNIMIRYKVDIKDASISWAPRHMKQWYNK